MKQSTWNTKKAKPPQVFVMGPRLAMKAHVQTLVHGPGKVQQSMDKGMALLRDPSHYPVAIPEGVSGEWEVRKVRVEQTTQQNLMYILDGFPEMVANPGQYTTLTFQGKEGREVMMSNTQFEYRTNKAFVDTAAGHVLVTGLGLGMILRPLASNPAVKTITVIEKSADVIRLVMPHYADLISDGKLQIIHADAFTFSTTEPLHFDCALHDIWPTVSADNLTQMQALKHRYKGMVKRQECWVEDLCWRMAKTFGAMRRLAKTRGMKRG